MESRGVRDEFDALIMAAPAWAAGALLGASRSNARRATSAGIPYSSSITINLIYDEAKIGRLPEGFGFLVPAVEGRAMLACTFVHRKFLGRTPPGKAVFRAFLGGVKRNELDGGVRRCPGRHRPPRDERDSGRKDLQRNRRARTRAGLALAAAPWRSMPWAIASGCSASLRMWPRCPACASPATPTTASASPTASAWAARAARELVAAGASSSRC